jgi:hypothetical protein
VNYTDKYCGEPLHLLLERGKRYGWWGNLAEMDGELRRVTDGINPVSQPVKGFGIIRDGCFSSDAGALVGFNRNSTTVLKQCCSLRKRDYEGRMENENRIAVGKPVLHGSNGFLNGVLWTEILFLSHHQYTFLRCGVVSPTLDLSRWRTTPCWLSATA